MSVMLGLSPDHPPTGFQIWKRLAYQMVDTMPEDGATIIVMTEEIGRTLKEAIEVRRGTSLAKKCKMISVNRADQVVKVHGLNGIVIIDSSMAIHAKTPIYEAVYRAVAGIWAMQPA